MALVKIGDLVINLDCIASVREKSRVDPLTGEVSREVVQIRFAGGHSLELYQEAAEGFMAMVNETLQLEITDPSQAD